LASRAEAHSAVSLIPACQLSLNMPIFKKLLTIESSHDRVGRVARNDGRNLKRALLDLVIGDNLVDHAQLKRLGGGNIATGENALDG
jgi:hypothetical protein